MLGAAVRMATARGIPSLVVVVPIPWQELARNGWYDELRYGERISLLRRVVTANGGSLIDLHRELVDSEFSDNGGHLDTRGVEHLIRRLAPPVLALAGAAPPGAAPAPARAFPQRSPASGPTHSSISASP